MESGIPKLCPAILIWKRKFSNQMNKWDLRTFSSTEKREVRKTNMAIVTKLDETQSREKKFFKFFVDGFGFSQKKITLQPALQPLLHFHFIGRFLVRLIKNIWNYREY